MLVMRLILVILVFFGSSVFSKYYEKRRFDRSINSNSITHEDTNYLSLVTFTDYHTNFIAYKDDSEGACYLEKAKKYSSPDTTFRNNIFRRRKSKTLYVSDNSISKPEAREIAGDKIVDFCQDAMIILLMDTKPRTYLEIKSQNEEIEHEKYKFRDKQSLENIQSTIQNRPKSHNFTKRRGKYNDRKRRQTIPFRGRFRGQTQSQYLSSGSNGKEDGKAEAEATQQSSRAVVSGISGMGQAQSMSSGSALCDGCLGYPIGHGGEEQVPEVIYPGGTIPGEVIGPGGTRLTGVAKPGSLGISTPPYPGGFPAVRGRDGSVTYPVGNIPVQPRTGAMPGRISYPGGVIPGRLGSPETYSGETRSAGGGTGTGRTSYSGEVIPGKQITLGTYPAEEGRGDQGRGTNGLSYPNNIVPGIPEAPGMFPGQMGSGGGPETYHGGVITGREQASGGVHYPGGVIPDITGATGTYPSQMGSGGLSYPGGVTSGRSAPLGTYQGQTSPGGAGPGTGGTSYHDGIVPGRAGDGTHPGGVIQGGSGPEIGDVSYPGRVISGSGGSGTGGVAYPGGVVPGRPRAPGTYPSGEMIGSGPGGISYPVGVGPERSADPGTYPGQTVVIGSPEAYSTGGPGTGGVSYPGGVVPERPGASGIHPNGVIPDSGPGTGMISHPNGVVPEMLGDPGNYQGRTGVLGVPGPYTSGMSSDGGPGTEGVSYPVPGRPRVAGTYSLQANSEVFPATGNALYPGGVISDRPGATGTYPQQTSRGGQGSNTGRISYPDGVISGRPEVPGIYSGKTGIVGNAGNNPGGVITGGSGSRTEGVSYPGNVVPGQPGASETNSSGLISGAEPGIGMISYPGGIVQGRPGNHGNYPGKMNVVGGHGSYSSRVIPGSEPGSLPYSSGITPERSGAPGIYPGQTGIGGGIFNPGGIALGKPGVSATYPGRNGPIRGSSRGDVPYPGQTSVEGSRRGGRIPGQAVPRGGSSGSSSGDYPTEVIPGYGGLGAEGVPYAGGVITRKPGETYPGERISGQTGRGGIEPGSYPGHSGPSEGPGTSGTSHRGSTALVRPAGNYPGGMSRTHGSGPGTYPGGTVPGSVGVVPGEEPETGGVTDPGRGIPGRPGASATHPGQTVPGKLTYTGQTVPGTGEMTYSGSITPEGAVLGRYPGETIPRSDGVTGPGRGSSYLKGATPDGGTGTDPGILVPGTGTVSYPGDVMPREIVPSTIPGDGVYPGGVMHPGSGIYPRRITSEVGPGVSYPGSALPHTYPGNLIPAGNYPSGITPGTGPGAYPREVFPGTEAPGSYPVGGVLGTYPGGVPGTYKQETHPPGGVPGTHTRGAIPGRGSLRTYPGDTVPGGTYPGGMVPGATGVPGSSQQLEGSIYTGTTGGQVGVYPRVGAGGVGPKQVYPGTGGSGTGQVFQPVGYSLNDGSDSHALSSVKQGEGGTQASASAQGKFGKGTAQSQVSGTYTGGGSFSAAAGTNDDNKSAQTQVSGGKEGAISNAQGSGGLGKSQAQVQLGSDSGATSTNAQSSGWNHGTNSQVQASSKGGMADAQANGEGQTSSQAQIGFQPYMKTEEKLEKNAKPFRGGGTASASSGTYRGQSQSQIEGSFKYGITYTGAAQAGSGSGAAASRKPFNFSDTNTDFFKEFKAYEPPSISNDKTDSTTHSSENNYDLGDRQGLQTSSSSRQTVVSAVSKTAEIKAEKTQVEKHKVDENYDDDDYEEYEDEDINYTPSGNTTSDDFSPHKFMKETSIIQDSDDLPPNESLPGYIISPGYHSSKSGHESTSDKSIAQGNESAFSENRSLKTGHNQKNNARNHNYDRGNLTQTSSNATAVRTNYYTVSNSIAGKMEDGKHPKKNYEHRYYTKSSTCGYFTFSCNVVYGSNGKTKICKPKVPNHTDGTPIKCS